MKKQENLNLEESINIQDKDEEIIDIEDINDDDIIVDESVVTETMNELESDSEFKKIAGTKYASLDPTQMYLYDIAHQPRLTKEEQEALLIELKGLDKNSLKYEEVRSTLINANLRLVASIAVKFTNRGVELIDLISEGSIGLIKAIDKYDTSKKCSLATYAYNWIKLAIELAIQKYGSIIRIPMWIKVKLAQMYRAMCKIAQEKKIAVEDVTEEDIAAEMNTTKEDIHDLKMIYSRKNVISADELTEGDPTDRDSRGYEIPDPTTSEETIEISERNLAMESIIDTLPKPKYREIIKMRYGFVTGHEMSCAEIGRYYESLGHIRGITRESVRQIEEKALDILRSPEYIDKMRQAGLI